MATSRENPRGDLEAVEGDKGPKSQKEPKLDSEACLRLARWMDAQGILGGGRSLKASFVTGGASNELFRIQRGDQVFALRRPPLSVPSGRNETMLREARLLGALGDTDVPHPHLFMVCDDDTVIGSNFYLMEYVDGWSPIQEGKHWPPPFDQDVSARRGLAFSLVDGIAKLSRVDWQDKGLTGFGKPEGFHERQVDRWFSHLSAFKFRPIPGLDEAGKWLQHYRPKNYSPGIMHGDYQFANVMYRHGAPPRLAAILDWEMATIGDPLLDLAWVINGWPEKRQGGEAGKGQESFSYVDFSGMPSPDELLSYYEKVSGRSVDEIDYYLVLARFKLAIVLEGGYARAVQKTMLDSPMMQFGPIVLDMAQKAADLASSSLL